MSEELREAIARLESWIRMYGQGKPPSFIRDLETVIYAASPQPLKMPVNNYVCTCHERDGSYACDVCKSLGQLGRMGAAK